MVTHSQDAASGAEDDYRLQGADGFYRHEFVRWLVGRVAYRYERRDYDRGSAEEDYAENRVTVALSVTL